MNILDFSKKKFIVQMYELMCVFLSVCVYLERKESYSSDIICRPILVKYEFHLNVIKHIDKALMIEIAF